MYCVLLWHATFPRVVFARPSTCQYKHFILGSFSVRYLRVFLTSEKLADIVKTSSQTITQFTNDHIFFRNKCRWLATSIGVALYQSRHLHIQSLSNRRRDSSKEIWLGGRRDETCEVKISINFLIPQNLDELVVISLTPSVLPSEKYVFLTLDPPVSGRSGPPQWPIFSLDCGSWIRECGVWPPHLTRAPLALQIFHHLLGGGGGGSNTPLSISAPIGRREKHNKAFESSSKMLTKLFKSIFR